MCVTYSILLVLVVVSNTPQVGLAPHHLWANVLLGFRKISIGALVIKITSLCLLNGDTSGLGIVGVSFTQLPMAEITATKILCI